MEYDWHASEQEWLEYCGERLGEIRDHLKLASPHGLAQWADLPEGESSPDQQAMLAGRTAEFLRATKDLADLQALVDERFDALAQGWAEDKDWDELD